MGWGLAKFADSAGEIEKRICCGDANCFGGSGCETARWWTSRLERAGCRITRKPHVTPDEAKP